MKILSALGVLLVATSFAFASPCDHDVEQFCGDQQPGLGTIGACLYSNLNNVSAQCREWINKTDSALRKIGTACGNAAREYCRDVRPGYSRVKNCLMSNLDKLPEECKQALQGR